MNPLQDLAVIIPVAVKENALNELLEDLKRLPKETEIILVGQKRPKALPRRYQWLDSVENRAVQLNRGAESTRKKFLWFLHADSRLLPKSLPALRKSLQQNPNALHYFWLKFLPDGPRWMLINQIGCWIRSQWMGVPFGDQGFCLSRKNFLNIGGFPEGTPYGEDHLFVWRARQRKIPLKSVGAFLQTSARRYRQTGWAKLTGLYGYRWVRQAIPEWLKLLRHRGLA